MDATLTGLRKGERGIVFSWDDGFEAELSPWQLRVRCPCAHCVSEATGRRLLDPASIPRDLGLRDLKPVGNYAYRCLFSDGHDTGIYPLEMLREIAEDPPPELP